MSAVTNSSMPNGGVSRPIIMFRQIITPKCTRSMWKYLHQRDDDRDEHELGDVHVHQAAEDEEQDVDHEQEHPWGCGRRPLIAFDDVASTPARR